MAHDFANFRELGGLPLQDGKTVKKGKLYRSAKLYTKSEESKAFLDSLQLDSILDFRCPEEVKEKPDYIPAGVNYVLAPVFEYKRFPYISVTTAAKLRVALCYGKKRASLVMDDKFRSYKEMPFSAAYFEFFEALDRGETIDFHCTEGKDRTGVAAAIILYCLGASEETIREDYMMSLAMRETAPREILKKIGHSQTLVDNVYYCENVHKELFDMSLDAVYARFQSIDDYLWTWFGIDEARKEKWKAFYTE